MFVSTVFLLGALATSPTLFENTLPFVPDAWENQTARMIWTGPRCSRYTRQPVVETRAGRITIVHAESAFDCVASGTQSPRNVEFGVLPLGTHGIDYVQRNAAGAESSRPLRVVVRPSSRGQLAFHPVDPVALESIDVGFNHESCEVPTRIEAAEGGFRVVLVGDPLENPMGCDAGTRGFLTLGSLPPGSYRVALGRTNARVAWEEIGAQTLVVSPGPAPNPASWNHRIDLSGLWFSPHDAPSTGLDVVHSRTGEPESSGDTERLTVFWFTYEPNGRNRWYVVAARRNSVGAWIGDVLELGVANVGAPIAERLTGGTVVGTAEFRFGPESGTVHATLAGVSQVFRVEPLRWTRGAWKG